jgi:flagellar protein FliO/FliZ
MDILSFLRTIGALGMVLGMLTGGLWLVRRYQLRVPQKWLSGFAGLSGQSAPRRLELVERLALDPRRSVVLLRKDGREHMLLIAPEGLLRLETPAGREDDHA